MTQARTGRREKVAFSGISIRTMSLIVIGAFVLTAFTLLIQGECVLFR